MLWKLSGLLSLRYIPSRYVSFFSIFSMFISCLLWLCISPAFASVSGKLGLLVHRVKGSRMPHDTAISILEAADKMITIAYRSSPDRLIRFHKAYVRVQLLWDSETSCLQDVFDAFEAVGKRRESSRRKARQVKHAKERFASCNEHMGDLSKALRVFVDIAKSLDSDGVADAWEDLALSVESLTNTITNLPNEVLDSEAEVLKLAWAIEKHYKCVKIVATKRFKVLLHRAVLEAELGNDIIRDLLHTHRRLGLRMIEILSSRHPSIVLYRANNAIRQVLDKSLAMFQNFAIQPSWKGYKQASEEFANDQNIRALSDYVGLLRMFTAFVAVRST